jgi:esterase/lipase
MIDWLVARLKEPTTWVGITTMLTAAGVSLAPELAESIITAGVSLGGVLAIVLKEKG